MKKADIGYEKRDFVALSREGNNCAIGVSCQTIAV